MTSRRVVRADDVLAWALLALALAPTALRIARSWRDPSAEHGPLVIAAAVWLAWRHRRRIAAAPGAPWPVLGGLLLAASLWVGHAAALEPHLTVTGPAAFLAIAAHVLARHGAGALRAAWFPIAFGLFALSAPAPMLFSLSVRLKLLAAGLAAGLLDLGGVAVVRVGSTLHVPGASVVVDDGCSGLRGLMAIVAFAALMAHLASDRRRGLLALVVAVPAALAANVLRIVVMTLLVAHGHPGVLEDAAHEATGLAVYALALGAVLAMTGRLDGAPPETDPTPEARAQDAPLSPRARTGLLAVTIVGAALAIPRLQSTASEVARRLPERLGPYTGAPAALRPVVFELLGDDVAARRYVVDDPAWPVDVVVVHSADDPWRAFHPPDDCFLIGGWTVAEAGEATLAGQPARRRLFRRGAEGQLVYYWVRVNGREAVDALDMRLELFLRRLSGELRQEATLVRMSTGIRDDDVQGAERRLAAFAREALGPLEELLSGIARR